MTAVPGPPVMRGLWREVIEAAGGRCQCVGQCGNRHKNGQGRCVREDSQSSPLHAIPIDPEADPGGELVAFTAGTLYAACDGCHARLAGLWRNQHRAAVVAELAVAQESLW